MHPGRTITALLVSPLATIIVVAGMLIESYVHPLAGSPGAIGMLLFLGVFYWNAFVLLLVAGIPIHAMLSRLKVHQWYCYVSAGVVVSGLYVAVLSMISQAPYMAEAVATSSICGALVSFMFWAIALPPHNSSSP